VSLHEADALVAAWIAHHRSQRDEFWAFELLTNLTSRDPEAAWHIILEILRRDQSDRVCENLAAGPLEDLLVKHGPEFIAKVEARAAEDVAFRQLLGGVWRNVMQEEVWRRLEAVRGERW
jgi:hypothetical protein